MSVHTSLIDSGGDRNEFKIIDQDGVRIIHGLVPLHTMGKLLKGLDKKSVMDITAANRFGATMVIGLPKDIEALLAKTPLRQLEEPWLSKVGAGAAAWVAKGELGNSANWLLFSLTGFNALSWLKNEGAGNLAKTAHPLDAADLSRCRLLLEAQPSLAIELDKVSQTNEKWAALVDHWDEICSCMDAESPQWRMANGSAPKTNALMSKILDNAVTTAVPKTPKP